MLFYYFASFELLLFPIFCGTKQPQHAHNNSLVYSLLYVYILSVMQLPVSRSNNHGRPRGHTRNAAQIPKHNKINNFPVITRLIFLTVSVENLLNLSYSMFS